MTVMRYPANYATKDHDRLLREGKLAVCNTTGRTFNWWDVEVLDRYSDCTGFRCPACGNRHDDRHSWHGGPNDRMGYTELRPPQQPQPGERRWVPL